MKNSSATRALPFPTIAILTAALVLAGCAESGGGDRGFEAGDSVPVAPATRDVIVVIDGMAEPVTLHRYESPTEAPHAFSTYLPEGIAPVESGSASDGQASAKASAEGDASRPPHSPRAPWNVRFATGNSGSDGAFLDVEFLPPGTTEEAGRSYARARAEEAGSGAPLLAQSPRWGLVEHRFRGADVEGFVTLGRHEGGLFQLLVRYPPEQGDRFLPLVAWILEEWEWTASGEALQPLQLR
jgi:hypothetical protein